MTIQNVKSNGIITLDQTSWTQVSLMTLTPGAGDYLAVFSITTEQDAAPTSGETSFALYVNDVQIPHTLRTIESDSSLPDSQMALILTAKISPGAGEVVDVRYIYASGAAFTADFRELTLFPADSITQLSDVNDDSIATATWTTLDTMTTTPSAGTYLAVFSTYAESAENEFVAFRLTVDGTPIAHTVRSIMCETSYIAPYCLLIAASITVNGSEVVEIEWQRTSGSGTQYCHERSLVLVAVDPDDIEQAIGTASDSDTSTSDVLIDDMTISTPGASDYLVLFSTYQTFGTIAGDGDAYYTIYEDGSPVTNGERQFEQEASLDENDIPAFAACKANAGSGDIQAFWRAASSETRTLYERTLVAIREPTAAFKLEGVTYDKDSVILGSVDCYLYKDNLDNTLTFKGYVVSNASTGVYSFTGIADDDANYLVVFIKDDSPHVFDVTDHVLQPVIE